MPSGSDTGDLPAARVGAAPRVIQKPVRRPWIRRRRWRIALVSTLAALALAAATLWLLYPRLAAAAIRKRVVSRLESRLGLDVSVGAIEVDRDGHALLHDLELRDRSDGVTPLVRVATISIDYDFWASVHGAVRIDKVVVDGLEVSAERAADGSDNFRDVVDRLRGAGGGAGGGTHHAGLRARTIEVTSGAAVLRDERAGVVISVGRIGLRAEDGGGVTLRLGELAARTTIGPKAMLEQLVITAEAARPRETASVQVSGGSLSLWPRMSLTGIAGTLEEGDQPGRLVVDLGGGYGGADGKLWTAGGWVDPWERAASLGITAERFTLDRIARVLDGSAVIDYQHTSVDASLQIDVTGGRATWSGGFGVSGLNLSHPLLASRPVRDIDVGGDVSGWFDQSTRTLTIERAAFRSRGVDYKLAGTARMPGGLEPGGARRAAWHVGGRFEIPPLPCQKMLDGIPAELIPYLDGAVLTGTFDTSLHVDIDWADLDATELSGRVGINGCRVRKMPEQSDARRLKEPFVHYVEAEVDNWLAIELGPDNPDFVPITDVSPYLLSSLMTTEDSAFYRHHGFITSEFRTALIHDLKANYFAYGASSITMQMVKNVMLYSEKTLSRKLQELFLTWYIERELPKDRIFEIYINAIEYGPGLYGIGPASQRYFGKHPRELNPVEAAFFSSILPSPKTRYKQYCEGKLWRFTEGKINRILDIMYKRGRLTPDEYQAARQTPLYFDRADGMTEAECLALVSRALKNARPTNPLKK